MLQARILLQPRSQLRHLRLVVQTFSYSSSSNFGFHVGASFAGKPPLRGERIFSPSTRFPPESDIGKWAQDQLRIKRRLKTKNSGEDSFFVQELKDHSVSSKLSNSEAKPTFFVPLGRCSWHRGRCRRLVRFWGRSWSLFAGTDVPRGPIRKTRLGRRFLSIVGKFSRRVHPTLGINAGELSRARLQRCAARYSSRRRCVLTAKSENVPESLTRCPRLQHRTDINLQCTLGFDEGCKVSPLATIELDRIMELFSVPSVSATLVS